MKDMICSRKERGLSGKGLLDWTTPTQNKERSARERDRLVEKNGSRNIKNWRKSLWRGPKWNEKRTFYNYRTMKT